MKEKRILIVHAGGIGDLLLALPAMRLFCQAFSPYALELLGYPERLHLISWDLRAKALHSIDAASMAYLFSSSEKWPSNLKTFFSSFEVALVFGNSIVKGLKRGLESSGVKEIFLIDPIPKNSKKHMRDHLLAELKSLDFKEPIDKRPLQLPAEAERFAQEFWHKENINPSQKVLAIHPGSGNPAKNWPPHNFARVADHFIEQVEILLISGPAGDGLQEVMGEIKRAKPIIVHNLPLLKLAALLKNCVAYLGNDSGITHLAACLGLPTLSIFGSTDPQVWGPQGEAVQIFYTPRHCSPCWPNIPDNCLRPCLYEIEIKNIVEKLAIWVEFARYKKQDILATWRPGQQWRAQGQEWQKIK